LPFPQITPPRALSPASHVRELCAEGHMLYRGQNRENHERNNGVISPKGHLAAVVPLLDGSWKFDGKFTYGTTEENAARAHQIDTGKWDGCYVSTTRDHHIAVHFATNGGTTDGVIYHIDETLFEMYGVVAKEFADSQYPGEAEVSIRAENCGPLPSAVIIRTEFVKAT
jgi:hypothetical protein